MLRRGDGETPEMGGIKTMRSADVVVIVDQRREYNAVEECQKLGIQIVSNVGYELRPDLVDIPIPANDDDPVN